MNSRCYFKQLTVLRALVYHEIRIINYSGLFMFAEMTWRIRSPCVIYRLFGDGVGFGVGFVIFNSESPG